MPSSPLQGLPVAARTYRAWKQAHHQPATRTITDATVEDAIRSLAYKRKEDGTIKGTAEGLYGRRKMTPAVRRRIPGATPGAVDRAMRSPGLAGVRRGKAIRTTIPAKDDTRAGDLLNRDFTAQAPNRV